MHGQIRYKTWLWWTRFAMVIAFFQLVSATYLMFNMAKYVSNDRVHPSRCALGEIVVIINVFANWFRDKIFYLPFFICLMYLI